jgi:3-oxoacyl-[acyl-carrier protein] reductase
VGQKAKFMKVDALDYKSVKDATEKTIKEMGGIDILVGTVGGGKNKMLAEMDGDFFKAELEYTGTSMFNCANNVLGHFMGKGEGRMLFFTSTTGGVPGLTGYSAGKAVVESVIKSIISETGGTKITVNAILPGAVPTKLTAGFFESLGVGREDMLASLGGGTWGVTTQEEVARVALWLLSDEARRLKGQIIMMS